MTNDIDIIKTLKRNFINDIMSYGVQYDTTLKISAALEAAITSLAAPSAANGAEMPKSRHQIEIYHDNGRVTVVVGYTADQMQAYARAAVLAEREAAARICETHIDPSRPITTSAYAMWHAAAIRART